MAWPDEYPTIVSPPPFQKPTMNHRLIARAVSFGLAVIVTLGMLGGIDQLAQPDAGAPQWAQNTATRA